jgi:16S rRNA (guanine966-N2)-methyltransferase
MIRMTGGSARGRPIETLRGLGMRPTASKVRQAIFDVIGSAVRGSTVLDLFAGGGTLGLEALSRGARAALFVDSHPAALKLIHRNMVRLGFEERCRVIRGDAPRVVRTLGGRDERFDIVFLDPPYDRGLVEITLRAISRHEVLAPGGLVVVERSRREGLGTHALRLLLERRYGDTVVSYLTRPTGEQE